MKIKYCLVNYKLFKSLNQFHLLSLFNVVCVTYLVLISLTKKMINKNEDVSWKDSYKIKILFRSFKFNFLSLEFYLDTFDRSSCVVASVCCATYFYLFLGKNLKGQYNAINKSISMWSLKQIYLNLNSVCLFETKIDREFEFD